MNNPNETDNTVQRLGPSFTAEMKTMSISMLTFVLVNLSHKSIIVNTVQSVLYLIAFPHLEEISVLDIVRQP